MSRWTAVCSFVHRFLHRHTPRGEKIVREQENFAVAAEAVTAKQRERLHEISDQLERIYLKELQLMRGTHHHVDR